MNQTYTVKAGDTLYGISNQFGVSVTELAKLNNVNANTLKIGQVLTIPNTSGTNPNNMFMYTVKKGDNLYSIAQKYNTTVSEIIKLNNLKNNTLQIGQTIRIPETYTKEEEMYLPSYTNYIVKKGDTLYSIAKANNIDVDTLIKDNALTTNTVSIGQPLKIRILTTTIEECIGPDYIPPQEITKEETYTVKKGDSLYSIAKQYNTSVANIMKLNNLTKTNLTIGQILKIPTTANNTITYTVTKGDSLYSIAKKFNTTIESIKKLNKLTSNLLSIGQKLKIERSIS